MRLLQSGRSFTPTRSRIIPGKQHEQGQVRVAGTQRPNLVEEEGMTGTYNDARDDSSGAIDRICLDKSRPLPKAWPRLLNRIRSSSRRNCRTTNKEKWDSPEVVRLPHVQAKQSKKNYIPDVYHIAKQERLKRTASRNRWFRPSVGHIDDDDVWEEASLPISHVEFPEDEEEFTLVSAVSDNTSNTTTSTNVSSTAAVAQEEQSSSSSWNLVWPCGGENDDEDRNEWNVLGDLFCQELDQEDDESDLAMFPILEKVCLNVAGATLETTSTSSRSTVRHANTTATKNMPSDSVYATINDYNHNKRSVVVKNTNTINAVVIKGRRNVSTKETRQIRTRMSRTRSNKKGKTNPDKFC